MSVHTFSPGDRVKMNEDYLKTWETYGSRTRIERIGEIRGVVDEVFGYVGVGNPNSAVCRIEWDSEFDIAAIFNYMAGNFWSGWLELIK